MNYPAAERRGILERNVKIRCKAAGNLTIVIKWGSFLANFLVKFN
jgi:hypothetical protein